MSCTNEYYNREYMSDTAHNSSVVPERMFNALYVPGATHSPEQACEDQCRHGSQCHQRTGQSVATVALVVVARAHLPFERVNFSIKTLIVELHFGGANAQTTAISHCKNTSHDILQFEP